MTFKSSVTIAGGDADGDDDDAAAAKLDRIVGGGFPSAPDSAVSVLRPAARPRTGSETARSHHDRSIPQLSAPQCLSVSLGEHDEWYSVGVCEPWFVSCYSADTSLTHDVRMLLPIVTVHTSGTASWLAMLQVTSH